MNVEFGKFKSKEVTCETHGPFTSYNFLGPVWSKCPGCQKDNELAQEAQAQRRRKEEALAAEQRYKESAIQAANIPKRFRDCTLETFAAKTKEQKEALHFATEYVASFDEAMAVGRGALFLGSPGTGKTHLAIGIALQLLARRKTVLYYTVLRAIRRIKNTWTKTSEETEAQAVAAMVTPDLLIFDEIGIQFGSEFEKITLFDVLNERYEERKPTILISNFNQEDTAAFLGTRIIERLREDGGRKIFFNWGSHRKPKGAQSHDKTSERTAALYDSPKP